MIRVLVAGAAGRMGREVVKAIANDAETELVGAVGGRETGRDAGLVAGIGAQGIPIGDNLGEALRSSGAQVAVEFSTPRSVMTNVNTMLSNGVMPVVGTTGLSSDDLNLLNGLGQHVGLPVLVAPNFAIGAILMMRFAAEAAKVFPAAEIIEFHHDKKLDAPSGTALKTAQVMRDAKGEDFARVGGDEDGCSRGGEIGGIPIHSVRLAGYLAHQEVIFGMAGQTLTIRHDTITRECYMPGVLLAIKRIGSLPPGLTYGLEHLL